MREKETRMINVEIMGDRASVNEPGRLATAIIDYAYAQEQFRAFTSSHPSEGSDALIYCRKVDDTLPQAIEACSKSGEPLLVLSSGIAIPEIEPSFPMFIAPNSSLDVLRYVHNAVRAAQERPEWSFTITEHHQPSKVDVSGTAKLIADKIGTDRTTIISVRDWDVSRNAYNLPDEVRGGYAIHSFHMTNPLTGETAEPSDIVIQGRETYAAGALHIIRTCIDNPQNFPPGIHNVADLVSGDKL